MSSEEPTISAARALLGRRLRVSLSDGRIVLGWLSCLDALGNLLLRDASDEAGARIGLAVVPPAVLVRAELLPVDEAAAAAPP